MKHAVATRYLLAFLLLALLTGCSRDPNVRKQKYFESGQRYFEKGKYPEAAIQFSNAIQVDGQFADAHYQLAQTYLKMQNWTMAFQELDRTVQLQPDNLSAQLDMANLLIAGSQFQQAQEHIDTVLTKDPNNAQGHMAEANLKIGQQDFAGALQEMQKAISLAPDQSDFYISLALLQFRMNQAAAAEASFKKAVTLNPQSSSTQLALGAFYQQQSRFPEAEQAFDRAMQLDAKAPEPRAALARLYMAEGKRAEAEKLLANAKTDFPNNSMGYRMLGDFYFANGDVDKAVNEYGAIYKLHPSDVQVKKNYVQLLILKDRVDEAGKLNDEVLKGNPNDNEALIYRGQIQLKQGHAREASETLQQAVRNAPELAVGHYHLGVAFDELGNANRAEQEWRDAVRIQSGLMEAQRALAGAEMRDGTWDALAQTAGQIISAQPTLPDGYAYRAIAEINRKQVADGENDLKKAMEVAPQSPVGFIHMGNLRLQQKQYAEAQKYYEQALQNDPNAADALAGIANVYLEQKQLDKAIARIQSQIATQPSNSNFHYLLGAVLFNNKDTKGADAELHRAIELDKNNADARLKLGQVQAAEGQTDQAIATYQDSIQNSPRDVRFYILQGELYESERKWDQAKDVYQKALQIQPDNPLASNNLAYVMLSQGGNVDVALSMAQNARRGMPQSPNAADTLGWAYYQKGAYPSAIELFKEAIKLSKDNTDPTFYYHLGLAYQKQDQRGLARQQLERALKLNPTFSDADNARRMLLTLKE